MWKVKCGILSVNDSLKNKIGPCGLSPLPRDLMNSQ